MNDLVGNLVSLGYHARNIDFFFSMYLIFILDNFYSYDPWRMYLYCEQVEISIHSEARKANYNRISKLSFNTGPP